MSVSARSEWSHRHVSHITFKLCVSVVVGGHDIVSYLLSYRGWSSTVVSCATPRWQVWLTWFPRRRLICLADCNSNRHVSAGLEHVWEGETFSFSSPCDSRRQQHVFPGWKKTCKYQVSFRNVISWSWCTAFNFYFASEVRPWVNTER